MAIVAVTIRGYSLLKRGEQCPGMIVRVLLSAILGFALPAAALGAPARGKARMIVGARVVAPCHVTAGTGTSRQNPSIACHDIGQSHSRVYRTLEKSDLRTETALIGKTPSRIENNRVYEVIEITF